jgi:hypothetical protein
MDTARPVRLARAGGPAKVRIVRKASPAPAEIPSAPGEAETRENRGASRRAWRLSLAYSLGITVVFAALAVSARLGPAGGGAGTALEVEVAGLLAAVLIVVGVLVSLGAAPRRALLGPTETVIVGRFGRRYSFPGRERLRLTVLQRHPPGLFGPAPVESVEIAGGSTRRTFLLDEGLLGPTTAEETGAADAPR